jgi:hypothetical protein
MANEPPCWILDEHFKDTGKRNYSNCHPLTCDVCCAELIHCPPVTFQSPNDIIDFEERWKSPVAQFQAAILSMLRDVDVQKAIKAIVSEKEKEEGQVGK